MDVNELSQIKKSIEKMIDTGRLEEAKILITEYKKDIGFDDDIASMESIIYILEDKKEEALEKIREGLKVNIRNSDLYYNMGNIYENIGDYNRAYLCYEQAFYLCNDENSIENIIESLNIIKSNKNIEVKNTSIIILTYNQLKYTKLCVESIRNNNLLGTYEIIVVDNNSTDGTVEWLKSKRDKDFKIILNEENKGFPKGCNQGIEIANKDNNIMLLNNDTVIMPNSIFNLRMGLYSKEKIGATGSVSNKVTYYQELVLNFDKFEEYIQFAELNNIPDDNYYEERLKLIGFAMLINRNALDKVKGLDERFTPGNYEDDDISYRIVKEGYKILLCRDSYIHHFGSVSFKKDIKKFSELLNKNRKKFCDKWQFDANEAFRIYVNLVRFLEDKSKKILEVDSLAGATLLNLRNNKRDVELFGIASDKFEDIYKVYNIKRLEKIDSNKYDMIFLHNYKLILDKQYILRINNSISKDGKLIIYIDDKDTIQVRNSDNMMKVLNDYMLDCGFKQNNFYKNIIGSNVVSLFIEYKLCDDNTIEEDAMHYLEQSEIFYAEELLKILKKHNSENNKKIENLINMYHQLKFELRKVDFDYEIDERELLDLIEEYPFEDKSICIMITKEIINKVKVLNQIAISHFNNKKYDKVLPYLKTSYDIDNSNQDTIFNLAYVLNYYGEKELALEYASKIEEKTEDIIKLINEIEGDTNE